MIVADVSKSVEIIFGLVDNTGGGLSAIGGGIERFASGAQNAISPLNSLADGVKLADTAIVALGVALGGAALAAAGEFNGKIAEIGTLFSGTKDQVQEFTDGVVEFASGSTKSLDDITGALYTAVSAGVKWGDAVGFVSTAEKLAVAGQGDLTSSTNVLIGSMNAYGASADEAGKYSDILMQTVLVGQTTLPELAHSLSMVTSTAAAAGISFADVNAAVAALTAAGVPTSQAMTGIQAAISNIIKPTKEAEETAQGLGLEFNATALQSRGLDGVLKDVYTTTGGNVEIMAKLFGSMEGLKTAAALGADKAGVYAKAMDAMATSAGSTDAAFKVLAQNWDNQLQNMGTNFTLFLTALGTKLNENGEFAGILSSMTDILKSVRFSINDGAFDDVFDTLQGLATRVSDFMSEIARNLPAALELVDFSKFNGAIENLFNSLGGMFDGIDLSTPEGLADAIQLVVDAIATLINQGAGIAQTWGNLIDKALPLVKIFSDMSEEAATASGKVLGLGDVANLLLPGLGALGSAIGSVGSGLELLAGSSILKTVTGLGGFGTAAGAATTATGVLATALGVTGLVGAAGAAGYGLGTILNAGINAAVDSLTGSGSLGGLIYDLTNDTEDLGPAATGAAGGLKELGSAGSSASSGLSGLGTAAGDAADPTARLKDEVMELRSAATDTTEFITGYSDAVVDAGIKAGEARLKTEFLAAAQKALKDPTAENKAAMNELAGAYKDTATWAGTADAASKLIKSTYEGLYPATDKVKDSLKDSGDVMDALGKKTDLTNKELIELAKVTGEAEYKLEALASNERVKNIEASVSLNIANIEANAKIATSIIEGLGATMQASSDLIGTLFGLINETNDSSKEWALEDQIEIENKLKQDAFELQKRLTEEQIAMMRAQTDALNSGDGLITISGDGLKPHLEAFMWEILSAIQVKVNKDGLGLLLGM